VLTVLFPLIFNAEPPRRPAGFLTGYPHESTT